MTDTLPTVADMMAAYAEDAVDHAKSAGGVTLDYSPASVEAVEAVLTKLHEALPKGFLARLFGRGPSPAEVATVSKMYGGYVGEVLRRARGGEWILDDEIVPGERTPCLRKGGFRIWPTGKVHKRLGNGPEDNVWHYYRFVETEWGGAESPTDEPEKTIDA